MALGVVRGVKIKLVLVIINVTAIFIVLLVIVCLDGCLVAIIGGITPRRAPGGTPTMTPATSANTVSTVGTTIRVLATNGNRIVGVRGLWSGGEGARLSGVRERMGFDLIFHSV